MFVDVAVQIVVVLDGVGLARRAIFSFDRTSVEEAMPIFGNALLHPDGLRSAITVGDTQSPSSA